MPEHMKLKPGQETAQPPEDDVPQMSSAAIKTLMTAIKELELRVLAKIDSSN